MKLRFFLLTLTLLVVAAPQPARSDAIDWQITVVIKDANGKVVRRQTSRTANGTTATTDNRTTYPLDEGRRMTWVGLRYEITPSGSPAMVELKYDIDYQYMKNGGEPTLTDLPQDVHLQSTYSITPGVLTQIGGDLLSREVYLEADMIPVP